MENMQPASGEGRGSRWNPEAVINLAARAGPGQALRIHVIMLIRISTSSLYGTNKMPFSEEDSTDGMLLPCAATKKAKIDFLPGHPADALAKCADIGKAERLPGWRPEMRIEECLGMMCN